jgi:hypothetical protein
MINCPNCGSQQEDKVKFCNNCGTALQDEIHNQDQEENRNIKPIREETASLETPHSQPAKKKFSFKLTKKAIGVGAGIIVLIVILLFGFNMFLNKNPKELYLLSEWKTAHSQTESFKVNFAEEIAFQQKLSKSPSTTKMEIEADATYNGTEQNTDFEKFRDVLKDSKLSILAVRDPANQMGHFTLSYLLKEANLLEAIIIQNKENTGLKVPVLYDKMFYVKNSEFGDFMEEKDPYYEGPNELSFQEYKELFSLTEEQKERIKKDYSKFVLDNLEDDYFTLTKKVSYSSPDGVVHLRQIDINMSEEEVQQFILNLIDQVRADKELQKLVAQKFVDYMKASNSPQQLSEALTDVEYIQEEIEDGLYALKKEIRKYEFPEGFHMNVFIDGSEQIVDRKLDFEFEEDTTNTGLAFKLHTSQWNSKDEKKLGTYEFELASTKGRTSKVTFKGETLGLKSKMGEKEDIKANFTVVDHGEKALDVDLDLSVFDAGDQDGKVKTDYEFNLRLDGSELASYQPEIKGKLKRLVDQNLDKDFSNQQYEMDLVFGMNSPFGGGKEEVGLKLDLTNEVTFSDSIKEPVIENNAINVAELSDSEWYEIQTQLEEDIGDFIRNNKTILTWTR